ncbi:MAG: hypothetical protein AAF432_02735, partial [Planctomycetota bacterium]
MRRTSRCSCREECVAVSVGAAASVASPINALDDAAFGAISRTVHDSVDIIINVFDDDGLAGGQMNHQAALLVYAAAWSVNALDSQGDISDGVRNV